MAYWNLSGKCVHRPSGGEISSGNCRTRLDRPRLLHGIRDGPFVIGREEDLQPFPAVACMHLEGKDTEAILPANMEIGQPH